jgi:hypothetical protein
LALRTAIVLWANPGERASRPAAPTPGRIDATPPALESNVWDAVCSAARMRPGAVITSASPITERRAE